MAGKTIVVDPGHNGLYKRSFNTKQVPAGNGKTKDCNSSGTATRSGYEEHAYNWAQATALAAQLRKLGAKVVLTRKNDEGLGPCVNLRAKTANDIGADLLISIHADGNTAAGARGYHVIVSTAMAGGDALEKSSLRLAKNARAKLDALAQMPRSNYTGKAALSLRDDLATLNLLEDTPGIMMEMGNMMNAADAKLLASKSFRKAAAKALAEAAAKTLRASS
ncbi:MAG: N-acetylmuramoyl-L-alanine amidase [Propionibacteriaceae bacterium]|nr:N-acetylmuramoyl-L-alanine amidase [Propionibacteriaceae bacterium]